MPLPNPRVFTAILNDYIVFRRDHWDSFFSKVQAAVYRDDAAEKSAECIEVNKLFYNNDYTNLAAKFKWQNYNNVVMLDKEPQKTDIPLNTILLQKKDNQLTAHWIENGLYASKSFETKELTSILEQLGEAQESNDKPLIKTIASKFGCNTHGLAAWINLFLELANAGKDGGSLFSGAVHAIRTYAIEKFKVSEFKDLFTAYLQNLQDENDNLITEIAASYKNIIKIKSENAPTETINKEKELYAKKQTLYLDNLFKLSHLGDTVAICDVVERKLFSVFEHPNISICVREAGSNEVMKKLIGTLNPNMPMYYQTNHYLFHYEKFIRFIDSHVQQTFSDYEKAAEELPTNINPHESSKPNSNNQTSLGNTYSLFSQAAQGTINWVTTKLQPSSPDSSQRNPSQLKI